MILHVICGYPSKSQGTYENWKRADYDAYKFVRAVKGAPFNGYSVVTQGGTQYRFENDDAGRRTALGVAGRALAGILHGRMGLVEAAVVPVPASDHIVYGADFTGARIARAIATAHAPYQAYPNITFDQVMPKAADGGTRDPAQLMRHMQLHHELPQRPIVLLDDVTSTHGHLKAAARLLRDAGYPVAGAVCVAQTVWERPESMFGIPAKETAIDTWPGDEPGLFGEF